MVESARRRAAQTGDLQTAPPLPLANCDQATVELALGKPRAGFGGVDLYSGLAAKTAALLYGLAKSQACGDGNKRVALLLTVAFVRINGGDINAAPGEMSDEILRIANSAPADHDEVIAETTNWVAARLTEGST